MLRLYVAAPWVCRVQANEVADYLIAEGFIVRARWLRGHTDTTDHDVLQAEAISDAEDVVVADVFVLLNLALSAGKATELGMAYILGIPSVVIGPIEGNIFHHLPGVIVVDTLEQAILTLRKIERMES